MEANEFIAKLRATGGENDFCDLKKAYEDFKKILAKLPAKERISFSLNVLCIICRNLDKIPCWRESVNPKDVLTLAIDCVRETRPAERGERVKTLACICHIHKFVVKQSTPVAPELVLKLSYMPFEAPKENMFPEYSKTYWNILSDRISYLERLKGENRPVVKLLPKLLEDYDKVLRICDTVKFCQLVLVFLVKKLYFLYSEANSKELNESYRSLFHSLSAKNDLKNFKKLSDKETLEIYVKFNECFYTIMENSSKLKFKNSFFYDMVRTCISAVGHCSDLFHCLQTFYLNSFCNLLTDKFTSCFTESILSGIAVSCETAEKLSYKTAMMATYPFIYQLTRLYMEYAISNGGKCKETLTVEIQEACFKLVLFLMSKLEDTNQMLKCDNCTAKTGLHDALRLSFPVKNIITTSLSHGMDLTTILPTYYSIIEKQHEVLSELADLGCRNHAKCVQKAQTDIHNTAILLHKSKNYEFSIKIFNLYLKQEIRLTKEAADLKNISRGFYNKAICELDSKSYEESISSAYLSYLFSQTEGLTTEKHISLVIDIKAKVLKDNAEDETDDRFQLQTVVDAYKTCLQTEVYGDLGRFFCDLNLDQYLRHEFFVYAKLWPSIVPVAGVWKAFHEMASDCCGLPAEEPSSILSALYEVILETPHIVRTIHNEHFTKITMALLDTIENLDTNENMDTKEDIEKMEKPQKANTVEFEESLKKYVNNLKKIHDQKLQQMRQASKQDIEDQVKSLDTNEKKMDTAKSGENVLMHATLLFLKAEYDLAEASERHQWKVTESSMDPDMASSSRTIPQEHKALQAAAKAIQIVTNELPLLMQMTPSHHVTSALRQWCPFVPLLLSMGRHAHGLQLAHVICQLSHAHRDSETYIFAAGVLLSNAQRRSEHAERTLAVAMEYADSLLTDPRTLDLTLVFFCEAAIYRVSCQAQGMAARLVQFVQARILEASEMEPDLNLDLAIGRLLDAQLALCAGAGPGSAVRAQRHYLAIPNTATKWSARRLRSLTTKQLSAEAGLRATLRCKALLLWRRARSSCCAALQHGTAVCTARLLAAVTCVHKTDEAMVKIDNRLKYVLGLQPASESQPNHPSIEHKLTPAPRPEALETMLDAKTFKRTQLSPSFPCTTVPGFKIPDFLTHAGQCSCYACQTPFCFVLACQTAGLEASVYFRAKEFDIARHYFDGVFQMFSLVDKKLADAAASCKSVGFEKNVVETLDGFYRSEFQKVQIEVLIEAAFFELSQRNYDKADDFVVRIHEVMQEMSSVDRYTHNEVMNLMSASAKLRKIIKSPDSDDTGLEKDLENLKLSPGNVDIQKTPESKAEKPPKLTRTKVVLKDEDVPNLKRKVIKLNLEENAEDTASTSTEASSTKLTKFRIPVPAINKPVLETITPVPKPKAKPKILVTQPSLDLPSTKDLATPRLTKKVQEKEDLATPGVSEDVFFTPMTSVKTYQKKCLRKDVVKNLDMEFSVPKTEGKENTTVRPHRPRKKVESGSLRSLQRSTSPGDLGGNDAKNKAGATKSRLRCKNSNADDEQKK